MELSIYSQDGTISLYFLLPQNCKPEDCSKLLKYAYQACREHDLGPIWLSSDECLKMTPSKQDVFVCDPFEGVAFDHLLSGAFKCVRVLGPHCLLTCLHTKKPVPELPSPLHNMAMHEIVITSTGFEKDDKANLQHLVEKMCGIYSNSFHEGITHLVAKTVGTKKCLVAAEKEVPIMTEEWIKAVWKASNEDTNDSVSATQEQFTKFTCPVFRGTVICVSQMPRKEKDELRSLIVDNGGTYAANLEMSTTSVLITPSTEGDKYKHATQWRIPCLTPDWIHDSVENGFFMPLDQYKIHNKPKASTPTNDLSIRGPPDVSICSTIMDASHVNSTINVNETVEQQDISFLLRSKQTDPRISAGVCSLQLLNLNLASKAGLFLDGCKIFSSGFDGALNEKLRRILNAGGATRFNNLTDAVTHVLVGKHVDEHMNTIQSWTAKPQVVTADWLVECVTQGRTVEDARFSYLKADPSPQLASPVAKSPPVKVSETLPQAKELHNDVTVVDEELMNQYLSNRGADGGGRRSVGERSMDCSALPDSQESTCGAGLFKGRTFTVSGYSQDLEEELTDVICVNGGEVADVNSSRAVDYAIVSLEGKGVFHPRAKHYVTHLFLEECLEQEMLLAVEYFHLPFVWPSDAAILSDCVIATSVYKGKERPFLSHIASQMGAVYQDMFARKDNPKKGVRCSTHLLCPSPEGSKYSAAQKWGVPVVTKDWLLKCVETGSRVEEDPYRVERNPPQETNGEKALLLLLKREGLLPEGCVVGAALPAADPLSGTTPVNRNVRAIKNLHSNDATIIQTPDAETIRKMYPTPGGPKPNDSLDAMSTPETPYGSTWYPNPSARVRKGIKRALDAIPDDTSAKRPFRSPGTPDEVYMKKYLDKVKNIVANHPAPKHPFGQQAAPPTSAAEGRVVETDPERGVAPPAAAPLRGVVVYASRKLADSQQALYQAVADLGGDYRWNYDAGVTHFLHYGRLNDTAKEFRVAREAGKVIVAPDWVWMCREEGRRVDEGLFPHMHNPKMSLSLVSTKSTPARKTRRGRGRRARKDSQSPEEEMEEEEEEEEEEEQEDEEEDGKENRIDLKQEEEEEGPKQTTSPGPSKEALAMQLMELETLALVTGLKRTPNVSRDKSLGGRVANTPSRSSPLQRATNPETESQGTAITWDDPQEREARARLNVALVGDTQDIIAEKQRQAELAAAEVIKETNLSSSSGDSPPSAPSHVFAVSGMSDEERDKYWSVVSELGGSVVDSKHLDPSVTHVVTTKPIRSEKHLAAIASGRWIVFKSFLDCSLRERRFVEEEEHEWGNPAATSLPALPEDSTEYKLALAAHRWRLRLSETAKGAFHGMKVVFYSSKERASAFTRLIEAGGGQVIRNVKEDLEEVTHCFVELTKAPKVDLALFASREIPCILPMYLNELLINFPPPDEMENCIPEYKEIVSNMTSTGNSFSLRHKRK